jgi:hypothetical protein
MAGLWMKWIFICLMMLNVLYFSWHQFIEPKVISVAEVDKTTQAAGQGKKRLRLVSEGRLQR